jgi:hypothetical protein
MEKITTAQDILITYNGVGNRIGNLKMRYELLLGEKEFANMLDCMLDDAKTLVTYLTLLRNVANTTKRIEVSR